MYNIVYSKLFLQLQDKLGRFPERLEIFEETHLKKQKTSDGSEVRVMEPVAAELHVYFYDCILSFLHLNLKSGYQS